MSSREPPATRAQYKAFRTVTTRWLDNDRYGHMNNAVHYGLFDTIVNSWLIEAGILDFGTDRQIGLVVETGCRYFSELSFPDVVTGGLRVSHLGTSSVRYGIGLFRNDEDVAAAQGFFVHVYVDPVTRRPLPLEAGVRATLESILGESA